jgi:thiamine-monophosphate kinase
MRENDFLAWITAQTPAHPRVAVGIGDDMGVVRPGGGAGEAGGEGVAGVLLKIDQCLDRVHYDLRRHSAAEAGRKAVNRCLSDCAGMACVPAAVMVAVTLPRNGEGSGEAFAKDLFLACRDAAAAFDCPLVGGDTATWDGPLAITVAAMGEMPGGTGGKGAAPVLRSGARAGDTLFVSGRLGGSILGRHLTFEPRIRLARALAEALGTGDGGGLHALMDVSDGLAQDMPRLCAASGVGAEVYAGRLPIHPDAERLAGQDGMPAGLHALADGEDYELLMAVDPEAVPELIGVAEHGAGRGVGLTAIGTVTAGGGLALVDERGGRHGWPRAGWEHRSAG